MRLCGPQAFNRQQRLCVLSLPCSYCHYVELNVHACMHAFRTPAIQAEADHERAAWHCRGWGQQSDAQPTMTNSFKNEIAGLSSEVFKENTSCKHG